MKGNATLKILILGASGTVGGAIFKSASNKSSKFDCWGTYNKNKPMDLETNQLIQWNIEDIERLQQMIADISPDVVISSLTGDFEMQLTAHRHLAELLRETSTYMYFISTANVFDGAIDTLRSEDESPYPVSDYGKFKLACEELLQAALGARCLIIRIPKIMTPEIAENFIFGEPVYRNLFISLNSPQNVADATIQCIQTERTGVIHLSSHDCMSVDAMCTHMGKSGYATDTLTAEGFAKMMGCEPASLRISNNGNFYFGLRNSASNPFASTCQEILDCI